MSFALVFKPRAQAEIAEAYAWYEGQGRGLGRQFLDELERIERFSFHQHRDPQPMRPS